MANENRKMSMWWCIIQSIRIAINAHGYVSRVKSQNVINVLSVKKCANNETAQEVNKEE